MKSLKDMLLWVVGILAFGFALWELMQFLSAVDPVTGHPYMWAGTNHLWLAILGTIVACVCLVAAFVRRPHVEEEIHITR